MRHNARSVIRYLSFAILSFSAFAEKTRLTFVNGIGYAIDHIEAEQKVISDLFGGKKCEFCHNPTAKKNDQDTLGYLGDLTQAGTQKLGRHTPEVEALAQHLKDAVAFVGQHGKVIHIAHSQGALLTSLAAKQLSADEMQKIEVVSFGGAAALQRTPSTPFHRCINYYAINDPLLLVVPSADQALRSGYVANDEFCFLAPRIGDPIADHSLMGATYVQALYWEGLRFQRQYQSVVYRATRSAALLILTAFSVISVQLKTSLRHILRPIIALLLFILNLIRQHVSSVTKWANLNGIPTTRRPARVEKESQTTSPMLA